MKADKIMNAIGNVDDRYITEAMEYRAKKKPVWLWKAAVAACLCIAILGGGLAFTAVAAERDYYKEFYTGLVEQGDNHAQVAQMHADRDDSLTSTMGYILTVTTDKIRYTVDEYIYVTARIENISNVEIAFDVPWEWGRDGFFDVYCCYADDIRIELYDTSYNRYDVDSDDFLDNERKQVKLNPGEYYSQTFRFSAKYISKQPDWKPGLADVTLPLGKYEIQVYVVSDRCGSAWVKIPVEIIV